MSPNDGKCEPEWVWILTLFTHWGSKQLMELAENLPDGSSQKKVVAMEVKGKKKGSLAGNSICNTSFVLMCNMSFECWTVFTWRFAFLYELSQVPLSMFTTTWDGKFPKNKAASTNKLKTELPRRNAIINAMDDGYRNVKVSCDDTDVLILSLC